MSSVRWSSWALLLLSGTVRGAAANGVEVHTAFGAVIGNDLDQVAEFLGIPFAPKPDRFSPPKPWTEAYPRTGLQATTYTPECQQPTEPGINVSSPAGKSEDCLHLNIYTPRAALAPEAKKLPVMLWIHGGQLKTGTAMNQLYNGTRLAQQENIVVVAINYRLGTFGFSAVELPTGPVLSNNGFKDQQEAMRWVRKHIVAFGGDASSVTLFGQSAGGLSALVHVVSKRSEGLFDRAISESGDFYEVETLADALGHTAALAKAVGCAGAGDVDCLRAAAPEDLSAAYDKLNSFRAVIDGDVLEHGHQELIDAGAFNRVPFIIGNNVQEGNLFSFFPGFPPASASVFKCALSNTFGTNASRVGDMYPVIDLPGFDNRYVLAEIVSDLMFHCGNLRIARALARQQAAPWMYSFRRHPVCNVAPVPGVYHTAEIPFVFQQVDVQPGQCSPPAEDVALAKKVGELWAAFARDGFTGFTDWPQFYEPVEEILKLDLASVSHLDTETGYRRAQCALLDEVANPQDSSAYRNQVNMINAALFMCQKPPSSSEASFVV